MEMLVFRKQQRCSSPVSSFAKHNLWTAQIEVSAQSLHDFHLRDQHAMTERDFLKKLILPFSKDVQMTINTFIIVQNISISNKLFF